MIDWKNNIHEYKNFVDSLLPIGTQTSAAKYESVQERLTNRNYTIGTSECEKHLPLSSCFYQGESVSNYFWK